MKFILEKMTLLSPPLFSCKKKEIRYDLVKVLGLNNSHISPFNLNVVQTFESGINLQYYAFLLITEYILFGISLALP